MSIPPYPEPSTNAIDCNPKLTIALPVFNGGDDLSLAVQSILNQSFQNWELLILDDGSTDGSVDRLQKILADPRVSIVRDGQNKGLSVRLNQAISLARGEYFARMDHDDISHPDRFAIQFVFMDKNPSVDLVGAQCVTMDEQGCVNGELPRAVTHEEICRRPWQGFYLAHPTWLGRTSWFKRHLYKNPAPYCSEDQELLLRASTASQYCSSPQYLLAYRVRTHTAWGKMWKTRISLCQVQLAYFYEHQQYRNALLSCIATLFRICKDAIKIVAFRLHLTRTKSKPCLSQDSVQFWSDLIAKLKLQLHSY